jgi:hypothetical protein
MTMILPLNFSDLSIQTTNSTTRKYGPRGYASKIRLQFPLSEFQSPKAVTLKIGTQKTQKFQRPARASLSKQRIGAQCRLQPGSGDQSTDQSPYRTLCPGYSHGMGHFFNPKKR